MVQFILTFLVLLILSFIMTSIATFILIWFGILPGKEGLKLLIKNTWQANHDK